MLKRRLLMWTGLVSLPALRARASIHGSPPSETIAVATPAAQTAGTTYTYSGTYTGIVPTALDYQFDAAGYGTASSPTIGGGNWSFSAAAPSSGTHTLSVRDHTNTSVSGTSGSFTTAAATITVTTPGTQVAGNTYTYSGSYTGGAPTALDFQFDAAGYGAASSPTIGGGTWSFSATAPAIGSHTLSVRDHNNTGISGTSGSFATATNFATFNIHNANAWGAATFSNTQRCTNASKAYECTNAGTSTSAPTGTGTAINNGGVAVFKYLSGVDATSLSAFSGQTLTVGSAFYFWNDKPGTAWPEQSLSIVSSSSFSATISAAAGESFSDTVRALGAPNPSNGVSIKHATYPGTTPALNITSGFVTATRLQVENPFDNSLLNRGITINGITQATVSYCIASAKHHDSDAIYLPKVSTAGTVTAFNNVVLGLSNASGFMSGGSHGIRLGNASTNDTIAENTFVRPSNYSPSGDIGMWVESGSGPTVRNNAFFGFSPCVDVNGGLTFNTDGHCATDQPPQYWACKDGGTITIAGAGTTGLQTGLPFTTASILQPSNASGSLDVRPAVSSALLGGGSTAVPASNDIFRRARSAPYNVGVT